MVNTTVSIRERVKTTDGRWCWSARIPIPKGKLSPSRPSPLRSTRHVRSDDYCRTGAHISSRRKMTGGFAFVAYPAECGNSGIMTFVFNQDGGVYQKDLGNTTPETATAMSANIYRPRCLFRHSAPVRIGIVTRPADAEYRILTAPYWAVRNGSEHQPARSSIPGRRKSSIARSRF
jgi:hypothetical protein